MAAKDDAIDEYLAGNPARGIQPHPVGQLTRVYDLATGSWIDEPGSSPGRSRNVDRGVGGEHGVGSRNDAAFDELFRAHLRGAHQALDLEAPDSLDDFIVAHSVVWAFTHPVSAIRRSDQVSIRTNCPGRQTYRIDDSPERVDTLPSPKRPIVDAAVCTHVQLADLQINGPLCRVSQQEKVQARPNARKATRECQRRI
jgi:hypothetical protein